MSPIDILIRSLLEPKGFEQAENASKKLAESINAGLGIAVGEKIVGWLEEVPKKIFEAAEEGVKLNATYEDSAVLFERLLGSAAAAGERIKELRESAAHPLFGFADVESADRILEKLTKGALATGDGLKIVGDIAAGTKNNLGEVSNAVGRLFGALENATSAERATMQLQHMGVISGEQAIKLNRLAESGQGVGHAYEIIEKEFKGFEGSMEKSMETFNGQMKLLHENFEKILTDVTADSSSGLLFWLKALNETLESPAFKTALDALLSANVGSQIGQLAQQLGDLSVLGDPNPNAQAGHVAGAATVAGIEALREELRGPAEPPQLSDAEKALSEDVFKKWREGALTAKQLLDVLEQEEIEKAEATFHHKVELEAAVTQITANYEQQRVKIRAEADDEAEKNTIETLEREKAYRLQIQQQEIQKDQDALRLQRESMQLERARLDADFKHPDFEKRTERIALIGKEINAIDELLKKLQAMRDAETDAAARQSINQQILGLQGEKTGLEVQQIGMKEGANPFSMGDQFAQSITQMRDQWGTVAEQMANSFKSVFNDAISSISQGITGLIMGTLTWGQALQQIGMHILTTIVEAIVTMGVRWIATQIMMAIAGKALQASMIAANAPLAVAASAIWATPATLATIASYGGAAAAAPGFIAMSEGLVMASSLAGFKEGGYTGDGSADDVAGFAHRGEFYFTAPQTAAIGRGNLAALARGGAGAMRTMTPAGGMSGNGGGAAAPKPEVNVHVGVLNGHDELREFLETAAGQAVIFDAVSKRKLDLGIQT
jgi:hypothetical protein